MKEGIFNTQTGEYFVNLNPQEIQFISFIGRGSCGYVQRAFHKPTKTELAIKTINVMEKEKRHQFLNDLKAFMTSNSPFLVQFFGAYFDEGSVKVALELMDLGSMGGIIKILKSRQKQNSPLISEPILATLCTQILNGLAYLHRCKKQVHRDIKPDNILFNSKGFSKLSDFGISKALEGTQALCETFVGTVAYMSPERFEGKKYSFSSDIWSFGLVLLEMATGEYPYKKVTAYLEMMEYVLNTPEPALAKEMKFSKDLDDFLHRCLTKKPEERDTSIELLAHPWITKNIPLASQEFDKWISLLIKLSKEKSEKLIEPEQEYYK